LLLWERTIAGEGCWKDLRLFSSQRRIFFCSKDFQTFFEGLPIQEFQVVQETYDDLVVKIVPGPEYTAEHTEFIEKNIKLRAEPE